MEDNAVSLYKSARRKFIITKLLQIYIQNSEYLKSAGLTQKNKSISNWKELFDQQDSALVSSLTSKFRTLFSDAFDRALSLEGEYASSPVHQALNCTFAIRPKAGSVSIAWAQTGPTCTETLWEEFLRPIMNTVPYFSYHSYYYDRYRSSIRISYSITGPSWQKIQDYLVGRTQLLPTDADLTEFFIQPHIEKLKEVFARLGEIPPLVAAKVQAAAEAERQKQEEQNARFASSSYTAGDFITVRNTPVIFTPSPVVSTLVR